MTTIRQFKKDGLLQLNGVCPYYTMFPIDFPFDRLRSAAVGEWVMDPFCGRGSTNYAARLLGLPSVGIDSNPVAAAIADAKMVATTPERIVELCKSLLETTRANASAGGANQMRKVAKSVYRPTSRSHRIAPSVMKLRYAAGESASNGDDRWTK